MSSEPSSRQTALPVPSRLTRHLWMLTFDNSRGVKVAHMAPLLLLLLLLSALLGQSRPVRLTRTTEIENLVAEREPYITIALPIDGNGLEDPSTKSSSSTHDPVYDDVAPELETPKETAVFTPVTRATREHHRETKVVKESKNPSNVISDIFYMTEVDAKMDDLLERLDEMRALIVQSLHVRKDTRRELLHQILVANQRDNPQMLRRL